MIVTKEVVNNAYKHFLEMYYDGTDSGYGMHLWAFIGMNKGPRYNWTTHEWDFPEDAARIMRMLAGPHYRAVAKMLLLRGHQWQVPITHPSLEGLGYGGD